MYQSPSFSVRWIAVELKQMALTYCFVILADGVLTVTLKGGMPEKHTGKSSFSRLSLRAVFN